MTENERRLLQSLALMCDQYLRTSEGDLDHLSMTAGQYALRLLNEYGLIDSSGRGALWSDAGMVMLTAPRV
jgi:hypothetical protein